jgi:hypothetical protein
MPQTTIALRTASRAERSDEIGTEGIVWIANRGLRITE